jgi:O-antigen ligase
MNRFTIQLRQHTPLLAEISLLLFLLGLFFPVKAAQSIGWVGLFLTGTLSLIAHPRMKRDWLWVAACLLMLAAGWWGMQVSNDPRMSWTAFWSYQTIGKGFLCALALSSIPFSQVQIRRLLAFLLLMLVVRNAVMMFYGYQHPVFPSEKDYVEVFLIAYRSQADHALLLFPFVLAAMLVWKKWINAALILMGLEIILLASTGWRGAWMGFAGACLMLFVVFRAWRTLIVLALGGISVGIIGLLASSTNIVAMAINRGFGDSNRVNGVWRPVLDMLAQSAWQGYGFGQARYLELISAYSAAHPMADPKKTIPVLGDAHNMILNFAMAAGWLGALAFVAVVACGMGLCLWRLRDKRLLPEQTILLAGTAAAWFGTYALLGLTDQPHYNNLAVLAVLTSVALASSRREAAV